MAKDNNLSTGKSQLNGQLLAGAANLAQPAMDIAQGATAMQAASNALKGAFMDKLLGPTAAFTGLLTGSLMVLRKVVRESQILEKGLANISRLQQIEGKFETLLKSATLAKQRIKELYEFTKNSPFKFEDVAEANRQLEALTYGAFSGKKAMQMVGDAAAATGQPMSEMSERVGKLYSALSSGRSIDKIAFQLQFTGLATEGLLGRLETLEAAGASFNEMWSEVEKVMARTTGGMENEMQTLEGLNTKLEESRALMQKAFAEPFVEAQERAIKTMTAATQNLTPVLAQVGADMAAVRGFFTDFKTSLTDVTLASPGMAKALSVAWTAAKTLWLTLAAATAINFAKGIAPMLAFANAAKNAAVASLALARASAAGATATTALASAKTAATAGNLRLAASEALVAARFWITSGAMAVHAAGLGAVGTATGFAAASNYALGASLAVVGGAFRLAGTAAMFFGRQVSTAAKAVLATPIGAIAFTIAAAAVSFFALTRAANAVTKEFDQLAAAAAEADKRLRDMLAAAKNTDDWAKYMTAVTDEIAKANLAIDDMRKKMGDRGWWDKAWGAMTGENIRIEGAAKDASRRPEMLAAARKASLKQLPFMGMGTKQSEAYARDLQTAQAVSDTALENRLQIADDQARVALLEKEADRLYKIAEAAKAARSVMETFNTSTAKLAADNNLTDAQDAKARADKAMSDAGVDASAPRQAQKNAATAQFLNGGDAKKGAAQTAAIEQSIAADAGLKQAEEAVAQQRRDSLSGLVALEQKIKDEQAKGTEQSKLTVIELQKQRMVLLDQIKNADQLAAAAKQRENDAQRARDTRDVNRAGAAVDPAILVATAQGNEALVAELQMKRQLAQLEEQIAQATRDGNEELAEALTLQAAMVISTKAAADAKFARDRQVERDANAALIRGDRKGAQAIRDADDLRRLQEDYAKNGMGPEQAKKDFEQNILAQAAGQAPSIVADSKQSIGGGGGAFQGRDPILRAQERIARLNEQIRDGIIEMNAKIDE